MESVDTRFYCVVAADKHGAEEVTMVGGLAACEAAMQLLEQGGLPGRICPLPHEELLRIACQVSTDELLRIASQVGTDELARIGSESNESFLRDLSESTDWALRRILGTDDVPPQGD